MSNHPPDHWSMTHGTWGTDGFLEDGTTPGIFTPQSGPYMIDLLHGAGTSTDVELQSDAIPIVPGATYDVGFTATMDITGTADAIGTMFVYMYDASGVSLGLVGEVSFDSTEIPSAGSFITLSSAFEVPSPARFVRVILSDAWGASNPGFWLGIDRVSVRRTAPRFRAFTNASISLTAGAYATVTFQNAQPNPGANYNSTTGAFTAPEPGAYRFSANARVNGMTGSSQGFIQLLKNGATVTKSSAYADASGVAYFRIGDVMELAEGDTVEVQVYASGTPVIPANGTYTNFAGEMIR